MLADVFEKFIDTCLKYYELDPCHYFSAPGLYGWSMSKYLPYGEFEWLKNVDELDIMSINEKSDVGYILEVDLKYPKELHKLHNDYSLAPEKLTVTNDMLSKYCKSIADKYKIKVGDVKKLMPNLGNKNKYVVHYRNLQLYLSLRIKLTKIHRVLQFKQSNWMKKYIDFNTKKRILQFKQSNWMKKYIDFNTKNRMSATNDFEKDFFKLMINSVYRKKDK